MGPGVFHFAVVAVQQQLRLGVLVSVALVKLAVSLLLVVSLEWVVPASDSVSPSALAVVVAAVVLVLEWYCCY